MLPESLQQIIDEAGYYEYDVDILKADISADPVKITFRIKDTEGSCKDSIVLLTAFGCEDFSISKNNHYSDRVELNPLSPLLWRFNGDVAELYVSDVRPTQVATIIYELVKPYQSLFNWHTLLDSFNFAVLKTGYGLLAKGSPDVLNKYVVALKEAGIKASVITGSYRKAADLEVFFIGDQYIIAKEFRFEKLTPGLLQNKHSE